MSHFTALPIKKQFRVILACLLGLFLTISVLSYVMLERLLVKNATDSAQNISQKFESEVQYLVKRVDSIFNILLFDSNIERLLSQPFTENTHAYINQLLTTFMTYSVMNSDISDIALVNDEISWSNFFDAQTLRSMQQEEIGVFDTFSYGICTSPLTGSKSAQGVRLVFGHNVNAMHNKEVFSKPLGSIIISIDPKKSPISLPIHEDSNTYFLLTDKNGDIFSFNAPSTESDKIIAQCGNREVWDNAKTNIIKSNDYLIHITPVASANLYIISAIDLDQLNRDAVQATTVIVAIVFIAFCVLVFLMSMILRNMVAPLNHLSSYIQNLKQNHLEAYPSTWPDMPKLDGCSEIRTLSLSFDELLQEKERLNSKLYDATVTLYETKLVKKQAELDFLRSQINPHFLYNALESLKDIAFEKGVAEIASVAGAMGKLFRYNVKGSSIVPLMTEMEITMAYLDIQKARFPEKLEVISSITEETKSIPIMKFLIQPLVENAVYHGIELKPDKGTLFVGTYIENDCLMINIIDDGIGIPEAQLQNLNANLKNVLFEKNPNDREHIGMINVNRRITLAYGEQYGITVESEQGKGTKVVVRLPVNIDDEKGE